MTDPSEREAFAAEWLDEYPGDDPWTESIDGPLALLWWMRGRAALPGRAAAVEADPERLAQIIAHRPCTNEEHTDGQNGKIAGFCLVCNIPWPCEYAGALPPSPALPGPTAGPVSVEDPVLANILAGLFSKGFQHPGSDSDLSHPRFNAQYAASRDKHVEAAARAVLALFPAAPQAERDCGCGPEAHRFPGNCPQEDPDADA